MYSGDKMERGLYPLIQKEASLLGLYLLLYLAEFIVPPRDQNKV